MPDDIETILAEAPSNWGRWGPDDELGALNLLDQAQVLRGIGAVEDGDVIPLGLPIARDGGDPVWPTRSGTGHYMTRAEGQYAAGKLDRTPYGGWQASDDVIHMFTHGSTHLDALGHVWYDDALYNGFDAATTNGGLDRCGIENQAAHGIVGRGVLLDVARHRGVDALPAGERITVDELETCADAQDVTIESGDILLLRLGVLERFYEDGPDAFYDAYGGTHGGEPILDDPGLTYTPAVARWFQDNEIPLFATDTVTAEQTVSEATGSRLPLHPALIRDQGVTISEMNDLATLGARCAETGRYTFCYMASPLRIEGGTGSPVNPLAIR
ncbi:MAG: cyclase family protein [Halobacteriales archaeon]|nr:cyclase family protein [Halobacteriales archaeon]